MQPPPARIVSPKGCQRVQEHLKRDLLTTDVTICIVSAGAHYALVYIDVRPTRLVNGNPESYIYASNQELEKHFSLEERDGFVDKQARSPRLPIP
jgi:hypothetical protein